MALTDDEVRELTEALDSVFERMMEKKRTLRNSPTHVLIDKLGRIHFGGNPNDHRTSGNGQKPLVMSAKLLMARLRSDGHTVRIPRAIQHYLQNVM